VRLIRRADGEGERLAVLIGDDETIDVADLESGLPPTMAALVAGEGAAVDAIRRAVEGRVDHAPGSGPITRHRFDPGSGMAPVSRPGKIIAVGRNYAEHAAEEGLAAPADPILFTKYSSSIVGPGAEIQWRASDTAQVDFEAELAVVIGRTGRDVPAADALGHVLGYTCLNDVSARDLQFGDGQWIRGKSLDTFCPIGPWLVTADEIPDPGALAIRCIVNGETLQDASTAQMIHGVADLIAFASRFMTLEPGDIIATGTPAGVGVFREPPRFLADGDVVVVEIEPIGRLENRCRVLGG
jgi:2-keto-4-pentenoate hydratase/2-oxohepta-3-ene-1,7-dioic acid hydratase in catechol pathway